MAEEILALKNDKEVGKRPRGTPIQNEPFNNLEGSDYQQSEHLLCINKPLSEASKQQILSYTNLD